MTEELRRRHAILRRGLDLKALVGLEIGPLDTPAVLREDGEIIYVDHADREELRRKYDGNPAVNVAAIPVINAVWGERSLLDCVGGRKVDYVIASHVAEHVPDLITWLREIETVLKPGGELRLVLPDKRFSFDYFRSETRISDLLDAYLRRARRPEPREVIDFALHLAQKMDGLSHYNGHFDTSAVPRDNTFDQAMALARRTLETPGHYEDVHCWVFSPRGFAGLMEQLAGFGLLGFECASFVDSHVDQWFEFYPILRPSTDRHRIVESWQRMAREANDPLPGSAAERAQTERAERAERERAAQALAKRQSAEARETEAALRARVARLEEEVAALRSSTSWRITDPLRRIVRIVRAEQ